MLRLDVELVNRELATSRTRAQRLIEQGFVRVDGEIITKASTKVNGSEDITVSGDAPHYVSRGAYKLLGALEAFQPQGLASPQGRECLDVGASTGGFTQVLLENGASRVAALDVGHGQLAPSIASDPRVVNIEGLNIREAELSDLPARPTYIVSDVAFISLTYVIPVIAKLLGLSLREAHAEASQPSRLTPREDVPVEIVLLIKPQFEVGKNHLGKNGIVSDPAMSEKARNKVCDCARANGFTVCGCITSPIKGEHGNTEYLLWLRAPQLS